MGQDPADTLHFRKAQVLAYLDGQGVKPPQHKPGKGMGVRWGRERAQWPQSVPWASQISKQWVRSSGHKSPPGAVMLVHLAPSSHILGLTIPV